MKKQTQKTLAAITLPLLMLACSKEDLAGQATKTELLNPSEEIGYAIGMDIGTSLANIKKEIDLDSVLQGIRDQFNGKQTLLTAEAALKIKQDFAQKQQEAREAKIAKLAAENKKEGEAFMKKNGGKDSVTTTESGLQYIVEKEGTGETPTTSDTTTIHYRGTLIDGTEFDSSFKRGEPSSFPVSGIIPGWQEALQLMKVGGKYRVFIPPSLAYGDRGAGPQIGPNTTLIFDIELLGIKKQATE